MTDKSIDAIGQDISLATKGGMPLAQIIDDLYPRALAALDLANDPDDANHLRHQIKAVVQYVNGRLPAEIGDRKKRLKRANKGNDLFLQACQKAGAIWEVADKYQGRPPSKSLTDVRLLTVLEAGFTSSHDARKCVKASKIDDEDYRVYKSECDLNGRQYTISGLASVYDLLHPKTKDEDGDEVGFKKRTIIERIGGMHAKLDNLIKDLPEDWDPEEELLTEALHKIDDARNSANNRAVGESAQIEMAA